MGAALLNSLDEEELASASSCSVSKRARHECEAYGEKKDAARHYRGDLKLALCHVVELEHGEWPVLRIGEQRYLRHISGGSDERDQSHHDKRRPQERKDNVAVGVPPASPRKPGCFLQLSAKLQKITLRDLYRERHTRDNARDDQNQQAAVHRPEYRREEHRQKTKAEQNSGHRERQPGDEVQRVSSEEP